MNPASLAGFWIWATQASMNAHSAVAIPASPKQAAPTRAFGTPADRNARSIAAPNSRRAGSTPTACAADAARSGCEENTPATTCQQPSSCAARRCMPPIQEEGPPPMMARRRGRVGVVMMLGA